MARVNHVKLTTNLKMSYPVLVMESPHFRNIGRLPFSLENCWLPLPEYVSFIVPNSGDFAIFEIHLFLAPANSQSAASSAQCLEKGF